MSEMNPASASPDTLVSRFFTRTGRDPLSGLAMQTAEGVSWPEGWNLAQWNALHELRSEGVVSFCQTRAAIALRNGLLTEEEAPAFADELTFIISRGAGLPGAILKDPSRYDEGLINCAVFCEPITGRFDLAGLRQTVRTLMISGCVEGPGFIGWTNFAGLLLSAGIAYESPQAAGISACLSGILLAESLSVSALLAARLPDRRALASDEAETLAKFDAALNSLAALPGTSTGPDNRPTKWRLEAEARIASARKLIEAHGLISTRTTQLGGFQELEAMLEIPATTAAPFLTLPLDRIEFRNAVRALRLEGGEEKIKAAIASGGSLEEIGVPEDRRAALQTMTSGLAPSAQIGLAAAVAPFALRGLTQTLVAPADMSAESKSDLAAAAAAVPGLVIPEGFLPVVPDVLEAEGLPLLEDGFDLDDTEMPLIEVSEVEIPPVVIPEVEIPEVEVPEVELPEVEVPEVELPTVELPEVEVPEVELPAVEMPEVEVPEVELPTVEMPEVEVPEVELPTVELPEVEAPEVELPTVEMPELEVPEVELPTVEMPEVGVPEVEAPDMNLGAIAAGAGVVAVGAGGIAWASQSQESAEVLAEENVEAETLALETAEAKAEETETEQVEASDDDASPMAETEAEQPAEDCKADEESEAEVADDDDAEEESQETDEPDSNDEKADDDEDSDVHEPEMTEEEAEAEIVPAAMAPAFAAQRTRASHFEFMSKGRRVQAFATETLDGKLTGIAISSYDLSPGKRVLVDAVCQAVSVGLRNGAPITEFAEDIKIPAIVRDALQVMAENYGSKQED